MEGPGHGDTTRDAEQHRHLGAEDVALVIPYLDVERGGVDLAHCAESVCNRRVVLAAGAVRCRPATRRLVEAVATSVSLVDEALQRALLDGADLVPGVHRLKCASHEYRAMATTGGRHVHALVEFSVDGGDQTSISLRNQEPLRARGVKSLVEFCNPALAVHLPVVEERLPRPTKRGARQLLNLLRYSVFLSCSCRVVARPWRARGHIHRDTLKHFQQMLLEIKNVGRPVASARSQRRARRAPRCARVR